MKLNHLSELCAFYVGQKYGRYKYILYIWMKDMGDSRREWGRMVMFWKIDKKK